MLGRNGVFVVFAALAVGGVARRRDGLQNLHGEVRRAGGSPPDQTHDWLATMAGRDQRARRLVGRVAPRPPMPPPKSQR